VITSQSYLFVSGNPLLSLFKIKLQAASASVILYLFRQGNLIFIREKVGNFEKGMSVVVMMGHTQNIYHYFAQTA